MMLELDSLPPHPTLSPTAASKEACPISAVMKTRPFGSRFLYGSLAPKRKKDTHWWATQAQFIFARTGSQVSHPSSPVGVEWINGQRRARSYLSYRILPQEEKFYMGKKLFPIWLSFFFFFQEN